MKTLKHLGKISEVFASIGGEGLHIGSMQLFIRLAACSRECRNCAHRSATAADNFFNMRPWPGPRMIKVANPIAPETLVHEIGMAFPLDIFGSISFVGGEPLCQSDFVQETARLLRQKSIKLFADTQAHKTRQLARLLPFIDEWSITLEQPGRSASTLRAQQHLKSLLEVINPTNCYLRLIINSDDNLDDLLKLFAQQNFNDYTLVLQPSTIAPSRISDWDTGTILEWIRFFQPYFAQIRWIPQVHKLLRIL